MNDLVHSQQPELHVAFAINEGFIEPFAVAFRSLVVSNKNLSLHIYILFDHLSEPNLDNIRCMASEFGVPVSLLKINGDQVGNLKTGQHFSKANYFRLYIPEFIQAEKVLYLDSDILVKGDLSELVHMDLGENFIAAVPELISGWHPELPLALKGSYFNSGVMLINTPLWKQKDIAARVIHFSESNPHFVRFADQCGLNVCIQDEWVRLPLKFNAQSILFEEEFKANELISLQEVETTIKQPIIVHYTGSNKPWHMGNKHPYRWQYWQNLYNTPFRRYIPEDLSILNLIKFLSPKKLKMKLREIKLSFKQKIKTS